MEGFETGSAIEDVIVGATFAQEAPTSPKPTPPAVNESVEDDAIDLYELGAVDYEPENIHHNA
jgi:hypothetical protein